MAQKLCQKCGKMRDENLKFYTYKNGEKTEICKDCLTMHIDNFDESTYLWLLEKMDVPYIPEEWNTIRDRAFAKNPNLNGMSVFGKYLSKMKLKQYADPKTGKPYGWADTDRLNALNKERKQANAAARAEYDASLKTQFENGEITEAEYKTLTSAETLNKENINANIQGTMNPLAPQERYFTESSKIVEEETKNLLGKLTEEDKINLAMKWGALYQPQEWIVLEQDYHNMTESFDIQDADTINTLKVICKTNLKMNQAIDAGDIEGFQKLSKVSESLRKSAKFTAAQNKEQKNDFVDSVGELVAMCERDGFIPRFCTDIPQDKVDITLKDMNNYVNKLVTQDLGFGQQIEDALKKIQIQQEMNENAEDIDLEDLDEIPQELDDDNIANFFKEIELQKEKDREMQLEAEDDE